MKYLAHYEVRQDETNTLEWAHTRKIEADSYDEAYHQACRLRQSGHPWLHEDLIKVEEDVSLDEDGSQV